MLDHVSVGACDMAGARAFYVPVLATLGIGIVDEEAGRFIDFGGGHDGPEFSVETPTDGRPALAGSGTHIAFRAPSAQAVDAFHAAALFHGGRSDGAPGPPRPIYGPGYYAAFVFDPQGNKLEAVWRD